MSVGALSPVALGDVTEDIARVLRDAEEIGCMAHKDADADSLGSALAFALSMRENGMRVRLMAPQPVPRALSFLPGFETLEEDGGSMEVIFTFDCATMGRFGEKRTLVEDARQVVNIDHHATSERFGTINLVEPDAAATGEVVYRLLRALRAPITPAVATNLYAALFTDTGGFRHENTTEGALRLGADLVHLGADPAYVALKSYQSRSVSRMRLEALAVSRLQSEIDGRLIWSEITQDMLNDAGSEMDESEGVIDLLQSIDTMEVAVLFKQNAESQTRISVRTRAPHDATAVCKPFGGGGHHRAAGAEIDEPLAAVRDRVLDVARGLLQRT